MKREFYFEFKDESSESILEYESGLSDRVTTVIERGVPILSANREGLLSLARILIQMAMGSYRNGYHVHVPENFDPDRPECVQVMLDLSTDSVLSTAQQPDSR